MRGLVATIFALPLIAASPVERAIQYLSVEVPSWRPKNGCFSCHNNGDGARALYTARGIGFPVPSDVLEATTSWLSTPADWDRGRTDPSVSDKKLARIQYAVTIGVAFSVGAVKEKAPLIAAAESLLALQSPEGSWQIEGEGDAIGSPVTWGSALATSMARQVLQGTDAKRFKDPIDRAGSWLRNLQPRYTPDIAAVMLAHPSDSEVRARLLPQLRKMQTSLHFSPGLR